MIIMIRMSFVMIVLIVQLWERVCSRGGRLRICGSMERSETPTWYHLNEASSRQHNALRLCQCCERIQKRVEGKSMNAKS